MRPSSVIVNAFRAGFQPAADRALSFQIGSGLGSPSTDTSSRSVVRGPQYGSDRTVLSVRRVDSVVEGVELVQPRGGRTVAAVTGRPYPDRARRRRQRHRSGRGARPQRSRGASRCRSSQAGNERRPGQSPAADHPATDRSHPHRGPGERDPQRYLPDGSRRAGDGTDLSIIAPCPGEGPHLARARCRPRRSGISPAVR